MPDSPDMAYSSSFAASGELSMRTRQVSTGARTLPTPSPSLDPAERLPAAARATMLALRDLKNDLNSVARRADDARAKAFETLNGAEHVKRNVTMPRPGYRPVSEDIAIAESELGRAREEAQRRNAKATAATTDWELLAGVVGRCERYLRGLDADVKIAPHPALKPAKVSNGNHLAAVEHLRQKRAMAVADKRAVEAAPIHSDRVRNIVRAEISELAESGAPHVGHIFERAGGIRWPRSIRSVTGTTGGLTMPDTLALLAWVFKDELVAALDQQIDELADDATALTDQARAAKLRELSDTILQLEREECALIDASNGAVAYRPDTDPRAVLGIVGPEPKVP